jgi:hypothetical protein
MLASEHILLESDAYEVPDLQGARKVHSRHQVRSALRRRAVELTIIDYFYLSVRSSRARRAEARYVLDLRFIDPSLVLTRHIPSRWLSVTGALALLSVAAAWHIASSAVPWWRHSWLPAFGTLLALTAVAGFVSAYRMTEKLTLRSVNGRAKVLEFTGGVGTFRALRRFTAQLAAHLRIAIAARRSSRAEHLRDEMREHFRLKGAGVLSEEEYAAGKTRILACHR